MWCFLPTLGLVERKMLEIDMGLKMRDKMMSSRKKLFFKRTFNPI
jgi:hypothetical protein